MVERHTHISDKHHRQPAAAEENPLQNQYMDERYGSRGPHYKNGPHDTRGVVQGTNVADSLIGQQPWKATTQLRNDTGNGASACANLIGLAFGHPDIRMVSQIDHLARSHGYHEVRINPGTPQQLPAGSLIIATRGWGAGQSHVGMLDSSGHIVNNSPNGKGEYAGVAQSWGDFMAAHTRGRRVYALVPGR